MKYTNKADFEAVNQFGTGVPNAMFAQYFVGNSFLNPVVRPGEAPIFMANVTFEPGCRNNWHIHHASSGGGQVLICTAGEGWYQQEGLPAMSLREGMVIFIPAGKKHWHGAQSDTWFSHIAFELPGTDNRTEWLEPVSNAEYGRL